MGYRIAVVGATGNVGREMLNVLAEREFPAGEVYAIASRRSQGTEVSFGEKTLKCHDLGKFDFSKVDFCLMSAGSAVSKEWSPKIGAKGCIVIDNSSCWRYDQDVPLVVPEVNPDDAALHEGIIANPNCSTMQLVPLLMALRDSVGLERVIVDTYQSVSGTGAEAVAELEGQIRAHADGRRPEANVYPHPIGFNALPEIDVFRDDGYSKEEWKVIVESRKILHLPDLRVSCTAVRVPVFFAHSEAVHVETTEQITPDRARELFAAVPGVVVEDDPTAHRYPLATHAAGRDEVFVGRVRADASRDDGRGLAFWVVSDNLRKGAATNAVQIAELVTRRGWLAPARARAGAAS